MSDTGPRSKQAADDESAELSSDLPDHLSHSFIVKVWLEETLSEAGRAVWRGSITHVLSRKRTYVRDLNGFVDFIAPFLESMGVNLGLPRRIRGLQKRIWRLLKMSG